MAVLRNSEATQAPRGSTPEVRQSSVGAAAPDVNKFLSDATSWENITGPASITMNNVRAQVPAKMGLIDTLFGVGKQFADAKFQAGLEEAYMSGIAQFTSGVAEGELEASPFTRDWAVAGYRDTAGKMKMAEAEAQTLQLIREMRESPPAEFAATLEARRRSLVPQFEGMSRSQRGAMFAQLVTSDQAAIQKHAMAHGEFIIDTKQRAVFTTLATQAELMNASKGSQAYGSAVDSYLTSLLTNSIMDESLPIELRQSYLAEGVEHAIASGNPQVYEMLAGREINFPDGTTGTVLSRLPLDTINQLGSKYRNAVSGIITDSMMDAQNELAVMRNILDGNDPTASIPDFPSFDRWVKGMVTNGAMSVKETDTYYAKYWKAQGTVANMDNTAKHYANGDPAALAAMNLTMADGAKAYDNKQRREGRPVQERVRNNLLMAEKQSSTDGFALVGKELSDYFAKFGMPGSAGPNNDELAVINATVTTLDNMRNSGNQVAMAMFLSGMSAKHAELTTTALSILSENPDPVSAMRQTQETIAKRSVRDTNKEQAAVLGVQDQMETLAQQKLGPYLWFQGWFPWGDAESEAVAPKLTLGEYLTGATPATIEQSNHMKNLVNGYFIEATRRSPDIAGTPQGAERLYDQAIARAQANSVDYGQNKLHLHAGQTVQGLFGVTNDIAQPGRGMIGRALAKYTDEEIKGNLGGSVQWSVASAGGGTLFYKHYDADGRLVASGDAQARTIGKKATELNRAEMKKVDEVAGRGRTITRAGGSVTFNGESSSPVEPQSMFKFRETLVHYEDISTKAYPDGGRLAVGVGINQTSGLLPSNIKEGDEVTQEFINETFAKATDRAAGQGYNYMAREGLKGEATFLLFSELSYQGGDIGNKSFAPKLADAIRKRESGTALDILRKSPPYVASAPKGSKTKTKRQLHYEEMVLRAATGR